jgi:hypothetical protein
MGLCWIVLIWVCVVFSCVVIDGENKKKCYYGMVLTRDYGNLEVGEERDFYEVKRA